MRITDVSVSFLSSINRNVNQKNIKRFRQLAMSLRNVYKKNDKRFRQLAMFLRNVYKRNDKRFRQQYLYSVSSRRFENGRSEKFANVVLQEDLCVPVLKAEQGRICTSRYCCNVCIINIENTSQV